MATDPPERTGKRRGAAKASEAASAREKRAMLERLLDKGLVMVHLDARLPGVAVPKNLKDDPHLRLNLSWRFHIPDFTIDNAHVFASLSFGGVPFPCDIPWRAVFAMSSQVSDEAYLWPDHLPPELWAGLAAAETAARADEAPRDPDGEGDRDGEARPDSGPDDADAPDAPASRPSLRVVGGDGQRRSERRGVLRRVK